MRASIKICGVCVSRLSARRSISSRLPATLTTISEFVRESTSMRPFGDSIGSSLLLSSSNRVVQANDARLRRLRLHRGVTARGLGLVLRVELLARRDAIDVAVAAVPQLVRLEDDVERLVPRHALQANGDLRIDVVGDHDATRPVSPSRRNRSCSGASLKSRSIVAPR